MDDAFVLGALSWFEKIVFRRAQVISIADAEAFRCHQVDMKGDSRPKGHPTGRQRQKYTSEIEVPFSGFTPLNTSSSPPAGANHIKHKQESSFAEQSSATSSHNIHLARHLGLGTDQTPAPLASIATNPGSSRKRKNAVAKGQESQQQNSIRSSANKAIADEKINGNLGVSHIRTSYPRKKIKTGESTTVPEFFQISKPTEPLVQVEDGEESSEQWSSLPLSKISAGVESNRNACGQPIDRGENPQATDMLPIDFDSDQLLSDSDMRDIINEAAGSSGGNVLPDTETRVEIERVSDSLGDADDDELFNSFINFPPVEESGSDFGAGEVADQDLVGLLDGGLQESQEEADEMEFGGSWLDDLDESEVQLLTPCSWPL